MKREPRQMLCRLMQEADAVAFIQDGRRCRAMLNDLCGPLGKGRNVFEREIALLALAQDAGVAQRLWQARRQQGALLPAVLLAREIDGLLKVFMLKEAAARWAVVSWGLALGIIAEEPEDLFRPVIYDFTATPTVIEEGKPVWLSWTVGGTRLTSTLNAGLGDVTGRESIEIYPDAPKRTYTLTVRNSRGEDRRSVQVNAPELRILRFNANKTVGVEGGTVLLSWEVAHARQVSIYPEVGDVTGEQGREVTVGGTDTTFTLTALGHFGQVATATFHLKVAKITAFSAEPPRMGGRALLPARTFNLAWSTKSVERAEISGIGEVPVRGRVAIPEAAGKVSYTLSATTASGDVLRETRRLRPCRIRAFEAGSSLVFDGMKVRLSWRVSGARRLYVKGLEARGLKEVTGLRSLEVVARASMTELMLIVVGDVNVARRALELHFVPRPAQVEVSLPDKVHEVAFPEEVLAVPFPEEALSLPFSGEALAVPFPEEALSVPFPEEAWSLSFPADVLLTADLEEELDALLCKRMREEEERRKEEEQRMESEKEADDMLEGGEEAPPGNEPPTLREATGEAPDKRRKAWLGGARATLTRILNGTIR